MIDGVVNLDRKEAIRNKMMVLDKEYAKSRILTEQSQSELKDQLTTSYFKSREEPIIKPYKIQNDFEAQKNDEDTSEKLLQK